MAKGRAHKAIAGSDAPTPTTGAGEQTRPKRILSQEARDRIVADSSMRRSAQSGVPATVGVDVELTELIPGDLYASWVAGHLPVEEIRNIRAIACTVFEDQAVADEWLKEPNLATNNKAPIDLLGTPEGFESVKNLLFRIEYGVLA